MEWIERRAGFIGIGALVVAAVALGFAIAGGSGSDRARGGFRVERFDGPLGVPRPFEGGPLQRHFEAAPSMPVPGGGPYVRTFPGAPGMGGFLMGGALHGELTLPAPNGKTQTVDVQRGTVTSLSSSSLTVKSSDGFTRTYVLPKALARGVAKGDQVQLRATVTNGKATVTSLRSVRTRG